MILRTSFKFSQTNCYAAKAKTIGCELTGLMSQNIFENRFRYSHFIIILRTNILKLEQKQLGTFNIAKIIFLFLSNKLINARYKI